MIRWIRVDVSIESSDRNEAVTAEKSDIPTFSVNLKRAAVRSFSLSPFLYTRVKHYDGAKVALFLNIQFRLDRIYRLILASNAFYSLFNDNLGFANLQRILGANHDSLTRQTRLINK